MSQLEKIPFCLRCFAEFIIKSILKEIFYLAKNDRFNGISMLLHHSLTSPRVGGQSPQFSFTDAVVYISEETTNGTELTETKLKTIPH